MYCRVSTARQGISGLGLQAQKDAVNKFLNGGDWALLETFVEVESGGKGSDKRPKLAEALALCKRQKATLIVAKMDRLARDVQLILSIVDSCVSVRFVDFPSIPEGAAGRFMLTMLAAAAEFERRVISERTKAGLAVAKAKGKVLGKVENLRPNVLQRQQSADSFALSLKGVVEGMQARELTQKAMVAELNAMGGQGLKATKGGVWSLTQLQRLLGRLDAIAQV